MRSIPEELAAHLAGEATTTCHCWRVTRRDGAVLGFTDHDHDLAFDGTLFLAASGFAGSEVEAGTGLAASVDEVAGGFSSEVIREEDLAAGLYDGARVERFLVNWDAPEAHMLLDMREVGEVTRSGEAFSAELRSMAHRLAQPQARVYNRRCDAELRDGRCRVDLSAWQGSGSVLAVTDASTISVGGLDGFAEGFFRLGVLSLADGRRIDVEADRQLPDGARELSLWLPLEGAPGDVLAPGQGVHHHRRLRQDLRHLPRTLRQPGQLPRLSARSGQRLRLLLCGRGGTSRWRGHLFMTGQGARIVALAESWIGTPYRHQGATKGVGCDCIGLVRGIWRELYGDEPEAVPAYAPDWAERSGEERLLAAGLRLFGPALPVDAAAPGDLLLFRWRPDCAAKHAGILAGPRHFIHAYEQAAVICSALVPSWRRRIVAVHRFPEVSSN